MVLELDSNVNMGKVEKSTDFVDELKDLLDLLKEGTSYILHIYLSFLSKIVPLDFIEKLFDDHKDKSSYNFSEDGKTYIYRLLNSIIELEKKLVAMGLQYLHTTIPLPFLKTIYENFCINNNLECTDVKLRKCKKALQCSNKSKTSKSNGNNQGTTKVNNSVSKPLPLSTPKVPNETNNSKRIISDRNVGTNTDKAEPFKTSITPVISPSLTSGELLYLKKSSPIDVSVGSNLTRINSLQSTQNFKSLGTQIATAVPAFPNSQLSATNVPVSKSLNNSNLKTSSNSNISFESNPSNNSVFISNADSHIVRQENEGKQETKPSPLNINPLPLVNLSKNAFKTDGFSPVYTAGGSNLVMKSQTKISTSVLTPIVIPKAEIGESKNAIPSANPVFKPSKDILKLEKVGNPISSEILPTKSSISQFDVSLPSFDSLPNPFTFPIPKSTDNSTPKLPPLSVPSFEPLPDLFSHSLSTTASPSEDNKNPFSYKPLPDPFSNSLFAFSENS